VVVKDRKEARDKAGFSIKTISLLASRNFQWTMPISGTDRPEAMALIDLPVSR